MKPPFEKAESVETQLFGARQGQDEFIVDIEEPSPKKDNEEKLEATIEPVIINVVENGRKTEGNVCYYFVFYSNHKTSRIFLHNENYTIIEKSIFITQTKKSNNNK